MQFEIMYLLSEIQCPVEAGAVVVDQLGIGNFLADSIDQFCHFGDMRIWRFNPKQIRAIFQICNAIQNSPVFKKDKKRNLEKNSKKILLLLSSFFLLKNRYEKKLFKVYKIENIKKKLRPFW